MVRQDNNRNNELPKTAVPFETAVGYSNFRFSVIALSDFLKS